MLGIAGGMGWLVARGLIQGETWFPSKRVSSHRVVDRTREPGTFWTVLGLYSVLCLGAAGFAGWLAREGLSAPDGVFRRTGVRASYDDADEHRSTPRSLPSVPLTLDDIRTWIAQTESAQRRAAADQLLNEALALPHLSATERTAAFLRIRELERAAPDYQLRSFGASVLELIGDSLSDPALKKVIYAEAVELAQWYAAGATSGGEGTARSTHVREIEGKLHTLVEGLPTLPVKNTHSSAPSPLNQLPPLLSQSPSTQRSQFLTAFGWVFIIAGALATPVSLISILMILAGGDGSTGGSFLDAAIVIGGPPATLISGIGLLRRRRWAYSYAFALLGFFLTYSLARILRGSTPEVSTTSPNGVVTTVLGSTPLYPLHLLVIAMCIGLLVKLRSPAIRAEFAHRAAIHS